MNTLLLVSLMSFLPQAVAPYKPDTEFKIELDYKFKARPMADNSSIDINESRADRDRKNSGGNPLPYLIIHFSLLQLGEEEVRIRCTDNFDKNRLLRKAELNKKYVIEVGFTDDAKDRVTPHEYIINMLSADKREVSRIVLLIEQDGSFFVNGGKRGKF